MDIWNEKKTSKNIYKVHFVKVHFNNQVVKHEKVYPPSQGVVSLLRGFGFTSIIFLITFIVPY